MTNKKIITIGIPVYNGEEGIQKTIESILNQRDYNLLKNDVEVLIVDNCSTDSTIVKANEYSSDVKIIKNDKNLGYDKNVERVIRNSSGEYIWFLGCGDILLENTLYSLVSFIKNNTYELYSLGFSIYDVLNNKNEVVANNKINNYLLSDNDQIIEYSKLITPLSCNLVNRNMLLKILNEPLVGVGWAHFERVIDIIIKSNAKNACHYNLACFQLEREIGGWWSKNGNLLINIMSLRSIILKKVKANKSLYLKAYREFKVKELLSYISIAKKQNMHISFDIIKQFFSLYPKYLVVILFIPKWLFALISKVRKTK